jgi:hypothetical protein
MPELIREALTHIPPSKGTPTCYPCRVTLKSGESLDTVYILSEKPYLFYWGIYPEDDPAKKWIRIEDIAEVEDSPIRLPARFAEEIYRRGESGMGYTVFTVVFADGSRQACVNGNAIDFVNYPLGKGPADAIEVLPMRAEIPSWLRGRTITGAFIRNRWNGPRLRLSPVCPTRSFPRNKLLLFAGWRPPHA